MISEILQTTNNQNWEYINISKEQFYSQISWIENPVNEWPPHQFVWSIRDDIMLLFLLSFSFKTKEEYKLWLLKETGSQLSDKQELILDFLLQRKENDLSITESIIHNQFDHLNLTLDILTKGLLWFDPCNFWFSEYHSILINSRRMYEASISIKNEDAGKQESKLFLIEEDNPMIQTQIFDKVQRHCYDLVKGNHLTSKPETLLLQSYNYLQYAISEFFEDKVKTDKKWMEKEIKILERNWAKSRIEFWKKAL